MKFPVNWCNLRSLSNFSAKKLQQFPKKLMKPNRSFFIAIEGNIASGKSNALKYFSRFNELTIVNEPIERWRNVEDSGVNLFKKFYTDPKRWCMAFQSYVQLTMMQTQLEYRDYPLCVMERSMYSARHCFVENLYRKGVMTDVEFHILDGWYREIEALLPMDLVFYIRVDPEVCHERILSRGREEEMDISLDYIRDLHDLHEEWLVRPKHAHLKNTDVRVIDGNQPLEEIHKVFEAEMTALLRSHRRLKA